MEEVFEREDIFLFWEFSEMVCQSNTFSGLYRPKGKFQKTDSSPEPMYEVEPTVLCLTLDGIWQQNNLNSIGE